VGIDRFDDADAPSNEPPDHSADRADTSADGDGQAGRTPAETRYREEYYEDLRAAEVEGRTESAGRAEPGTRSKAGEAAENGQQAEPIASWEEKAEESRWMWDEYKRRWPAEERPQVDRSDDPPGSWHGDSGRSLDSAVNGRIEAECDRIAEREETRITPALRAVESQDPDRYLVGFEDRLKGRDRIKDKVYDKMQEFDFSPEEAVSIVSDTIRFTFQYRETHYIQGVSADIQRLKDHGFELHQLKNYWSDDHYKGVNSQWIEPDSGQRFEVQFHTRISYEAKQLTHDAYERLRTHQADKFEQMVLEAFEKKVTGEVPVPLGAANIPDYPERGADAR
jgi:hypothetical protein